MTMRQFNDETHFASPKVPTKAIIDAMNEATHVLNSDRSEQVYAAIVGEAGKVEMEQSEPVAWIDKRDFDWAVENNNQTALTGVWRNKEAVNPRGAEPMAFYLAQPNLAAKVAELEALSVTNIMIGISPGEDGMGEEVYAKSIEDVEKLIGRLGDKADDYDLYVPIMKRSITELEATIAQQAEQIRVAREAICNVEQKAFEDWLARNTPSGDVEIVQRNWERSSEFSDFIELFGEAISQLGDPA